MADRGFDIENYMPAGVGLSDETEIRRIAALRLRVERAIGRIKNFEIIKNVFPLKVSTNHIEDLFCINCKYLLNCNCIHY
jgi:hypothetical protein